MMGVRSRLAPCTEGVESGQCIGGSGGDVVDGRVGAAVARVAVLPVVCMGAHGGGRHGVLVDYSK